MSKLHRIREAWENANPEEAAERVARRFEEQSIKLPAALTPPEDAPAWQLKVFGDAAVLYRNLVLDGREEGLTLTQLHASAMGIGAARKQDAISFLRRSGAVSESRRGVDGFDSDRIVLRASPE